MGGLLAEGVVEVGERTDPAHQSNHQTTINFFYVRYSTLLQLPPLRFHCVGNAGTELKTVATLAFTARRSNHLARSHPVTRKKNFCTAFLRFWFSVINKLCQQIAQLANQKSETERERA
jgi:hypothetical protein